jgi:hypothetical protein
MAAKKLPVTAWVVPDVQAFPPEVVLGAIAVGEAAEGTITLSSLTGQKFTVEDWRCSSDQVLVMREPADAGDPMFRVKWKRVNAAGEQRAAIDFRIKVNGNEEQAVKVRVSCLGIGTAAANPR